MYMTLSKRYIHVETTYEITHESLPNSSRTNWNLFSDCCNSRK